MQMISEGSCDPFNAFVEQWLFFSRFFYEQKTFITLYMSQLNVSLLNKKYASNALINFEQ